MQIQVNLKDNPYKVFVDEPYFLEFDTKVALLSNPKVLGLHLNSLLEKIKCKELFIISTKDGEEYKNLASVEEILNQLFLSKLDRRSLLISFGGGVISDMGGFVASVYQRGIDFINIPTTLLACVDAAVGGKTGINNAFGKNLIGSFYQPKAVYCQSKFLKTLNARELRAGLAEVIKMAVIFDETLLDFIENIDANSFLAGTCEEELLAQILAKSIEIKARIVEKDEKESGLRMLLNYGHTFAHVIEKQSEYKTYLHGEAVAIGINMANTLALNLGLISEKECERIERILKKFTLATPYKIKDLNAFYEAFFLDKKTLHRKISFVLPLGLGKGVVKDDIDKNVILKSLENFL